MRRVFVPPEAIISSSQSDKEIVIRGDDVKHIRDVLRRKEGDILTVTCGRGTDYICRIEEIHDTEIHVKIEEEKEDISELPVELVLFQALPKSDKMEWIIQKAVELGAVEIVPMRTVRSVVRLDREKADKKRVRWQRIAEEAAKQSGRGIVPDVHEVMDYGEAVAYAGSCDHIFIPYELSEEEGSVGRLREAAGIAKRIGVFIGSEGGFERHEVEAVTDAGGEVISLGKRILRTETAGMAVLSVLMMLIEESRG